MCHLCKESVNINWFVLAEAIYTEYRLNVMRGVPAGIEHNHTVCSNQVDTQRPCSCRDQEQTNPEIPHKLA